MELKLPQGQFVVNPAGTESILVLAAGGRPPSGEWLRQVAGNYPVWAIDRGADVCRTAAVIPAMLFGDADSGSAQAWQWAEELAIPMERYHVDKDRTDLQMALKSVAERRAGSAVLVIGGMGRRFDHALSNMFSLLETERFGVRAIGFADESEAVFILRGGQNLQAVFKQLPKIVSLLPLTPICENICSQGVHWPLQGAILHMEAPGGISNRLAEGSQSVGVSLGQGCLGVYFCWNEEGL